MPKYVIQASVGGTIVLLIEREEERWRLVEDVRVVASVRVLVVEGEDTYLPSLRVILSLGC